MTRHAERVLIEDVHDAILNLVELIETYQSKSKLLKVLMSTLFKRRQDELDAVVGQAITRLQVKVVRKNTQKLRRRAPIVHVVLKGGTREFRYTCNSQSPASRLVPAYLDTCFFLFTSPIAIARRGCKTILLLSRVRNVRQLGLQVQVGHDVSAVKEGIHAYQVNTCAALRMCGGVDLVAGG